MLLLLLLLCVCVLLLLLVLVLVLVLLRLLLALLLFCACYCHVGSLRLISSRAERLHKSRHRHHECHDTWQSRHDGCRGLRLDIVLCTCATVQRDKREVLPAPLALEGLALRLIWTVTGTVPVSGTGALRGIQSTRLPLLLVLGVPDGDDILGDGPRHFHDGLLDEGRRDGLELLTQLGPRELRDARGHRVHLRHALLLKHLSGLHIGGIRDLLLRLSLGGQFARGLDAPRCPQRPPRRCAYGARRIHHLRLGLHGCVVQLVADVELGPIRHLAQLGNRHIHNIIDDLELWDFLAPPLVATLKTVRKETGSHLTLGINLPAINDILNGLNHWPLAQLGNRLSHDPVDDLDLGDFLSLRVQHFNWMLDRHLIGPHKGGGQDALVQRDLALLRDRNVMLLHGANLRLWLIPVAGHGAPDQVLHGLAEVNIGVRAAVPALSEAPEPACKCASSRGPIFSRNQALA